MVNQALLMLSAVIWQCIALAARHSISIAGQSMRLAA